MERRQPTDVRDFRYEAEGQGQPAPISTNIYERRGGGDLQDVLARKITERKQDGLRLRLPIPPSSRE